MQNLTETSNLETIVRVLSYHGLSSFSKGELGIQPLVTCLLREAAFITRQRVHNRGMTCPAKWGRVWRGRKEIGMRTKREGGVDVGRKGGTEDRREDKGNCGCQSSVI